MFRRTPLAVLLSSFLTLLAASGQAREDDPVFSQIDSIVKTLSEITGFPEKHPVPYGRMSKHQLRQFLNKRIKLTLKPEELRADELSLKLFGLVPQDFDLKKSTIELLTEQAAAFYDYQEKKLFLLDMSSFTSEATTVAHELSHALADQNFDLTKYMQDTPSNDDENLAHTAVVEGQASWLMIAYDLKRNGQPPVPTAEMLKSMSDSSDTSTSEYPVLKTSPLYIQQSLLFPYSQGTVFFDQVYKKMGKEAFAAVFKDAPSDSAEIIHPDRYFSHTKATRPEVPKLAPHDKTFELADGSMGEFDHEMLIRQYVGEPAAKALAPHLRGGQFKIIEVGKDRKPVLEYASEWDSNDQAKTFFSYYQKILRAKWKVCDASAAGPETFAGTGDNGYFVTRLLGSSVSSVEGLDDPAEWNRLRGAAPKISATAAVHLSFRSKVTVH